MNLSMIQNFSQPDVDKQTGEIFYDKKSKRQLFEKLKIKDATIIFNPATGIQKETKLVDFQDAFQL